jgi:hypothetical protein
VRERSLGLLSPEKELGKEMAALIHQVLVGLDMMCGATAAATSPRGTDK